MLFFRFRIADSSPSGQEICSGAMTTIEFALREPSMLPTLGANRYDLLDRSLFPEEMSPQEYGPTDTPCRYSTETGRQQQRANRIRLAIDRIKCPPRPSL